MLGEPLPSGTHVLIRTVAAETVLERSSGYLQLARVLLTKVNGVDRRAPETVEELLTFP